jgi:lysyl endopeptidase
MLSASKREASMRTSVPKIAVALAMLVACAQAHARQGEPPYTFVHPAKSLRAAPVEEIGSIDAAARRHDAEAAALSVAPTKRLRTADAMAVAIDTTHHGAWSDLADGSRLWRVEVHVEGATDLRLAFAHFALPRGATLHLIGADRYYQGPYTVADAFDGTFHSSVVPGDRATVELHVPAGADVPSSAFELTSIGAGFRDLFRREKAIEDTGPGTSGECNVNVVCPLGQPYPDQIRAAAYYEVTDDDDHATYICSGTLLADVPHDRRAYFLSAGHCVSSATEAASMVVYWNYQSQTCSSLVPPPGGFFNDDQHGAALRATRADADFVLVQLSQVPDASWDVYFAGWDASGAEPSGTIGIHHPSGDVKKITAGPAPGTIDNCIGTGGSSTDTHWETGPYTQGTTEGGSSGSGLFATSNTAGSRARLLIGTLSGGFAACDSSDPSQPNNETDCYGKVAAAWNGSSASTRLRDWLDPANTGALSASGIDGNATQTGDGHSHHREAGRVLVPRR